MGTAAQQTIIEKPILPRILSRRYVKKMTFYFLYIVKNNTHGPG